MTHDALPSPAGANAKDMAGKVAVVTGSSDGIGLAAAQRLAAAGAAVVVNSRSQDRAENAAATIESDDVLAVAADVTQAAAVEQLMSATIERFGRIDVLVNNAGIGSAEPSADLAPEDWRRVIDLNLTAPFLCAQSVAHHMITRGAGVIVNVGSIWGHSAIPRRAAYTAAKHGIVGLTQVLASEWGALGVRVVSVDPGYVETELVKSLVRDRKVDAEAVNARIPMGRMGFPSEIAEMIVFVASDRASYLTGSNIIIDGGWIAFGGPQTELTLTR